MKDYKKFKWFYTLSGKLVVGGKNAEQNDLLLHTIKKESEKYIVMHTSHPGSPFSVIISEPGKVTLEDIEECAIFTGCFSRAWREGKKQTEVHVFRSEQVSKEGISKPGMWRVSGKIKKVKVNLVLALIKQKSLYRAVPKISAKNPLLLLIPGNKDKIQMIGKIKELIKDKKVKDSELLSALPAGGVEIVK